MMKKPESIPVTLFGKQVGTAVPKGNNTLSVTIDDEEAYRVVVESKQVGGFSIDEELRFRSQNSDKK